MVDNSDSGANNDDLASDDSKVKQKIFKYKSSDRLTPANILTFFRMALSIPFLIWMYYVESGWLIWAAFFLIAGSDYIDGIMARKDGPTTSGAFLDPLADKILAMGGFLVLGLRGYYLWIPIIVMAIRELLVSLSRTILARYKISLPSRKLGKAKTFVQLCAVGFPLFPPLAPYYDFHVGVLWLACALSVISGIDLWINAKREVQEADIHLGDPFPQK